MEAAKRGTGGRNTPAELVAGKTGVGNSRKAVGGVSGIILGGGRPGGGAKKATEGRAAAEAAGEGGASAKDGEGAEAPEKPGGNAGEAPEAARTIEEA